MEKPTINEARSVIGRLATIWMPATNIRDPLKNKSCAIRASQAPAKITIPHATGNPKVDAAVTLEGR